MALGKGNAEQDKNFADVFIATRDYEAVARGLRSLILGGRGAGKSAIFRHLADSGGRPITPGDDAGLTVALAADRTSWPRFQAEVTSSRNDPVVLGRQWELTFLILAFNALVDASRRPRRRLIKDVADAVDSVMERTSSDLAYEGALTRVFKASAEILQKLPFTFKVQAPFVPVSVELKDDGAGSRSSQDERERPQIFLIEGMYGVLKTLLSEGQRVRILADQLDEAWTGAIEQKSSLCALITAVMRINGLLIQNDMDGAIAFSIFLRSDIYEVLKVSGLDDASKYRRDELHLKWDRAALTRMINRRIEVARTPGISTIEEVFEDTRLDRRRLIDYFFDRVVPKPRDVIQFLGFCVDESELRGEDRVSSEALSVADSAYSAWRRDVILEETRYRGLVKSPGSLLNAMAAGPRSYSERELNQRLANSKREYDLSESKPVLLGALFDMGIIGVERSGGPAQYVWDVIDRSQLRPSSDASDDRADSYVVHPSLWTALDLRAATRSRRSPETVTNPTAAEQRSGGRVSTRRRRP
jgi:hypothetical protein